MVEGEEPGAIARRVIDPNRFMTTEKGEVNL